MMRRVYTIIKGHVKTWFRSKSTIFWTIAFPILLIVLFGAIFGGGSTKFDLYVQNQDLAASTPTPASHGFVTALANTTAFNIRTVPAEMTNPLSYVRDDAQLHNRGQRLLVIPAGFQNNLTAGQALIQLYMDQSDQASASLSGIIYAVANTFATRYKGIGRVFFNVTVTIDIYTVAIVVAASLLFPGIGMVLANFVKDADGAEAAANAITFPMMFLAGTFWPRETMPDILKVVSSYLPLTYVNDGLRDAMIYLQPAQALTNTVIALGLAVGFVILGSVLMNWKEE